MVKYRESSTDEDDNEEEELPEDPDAMEVEDSEPAVEEMVG